VVAVAREAQLSCRRHQVAHAVARLHRHQPTALRTRLQSQVFRREPFDYGGEFLLRGVSLIHLDERLDVVEARELAARRRASSFNNSASLSSPSFVPSCGASVLALNFLVFRRGISPS
jgi:hypothetical protein